MSKRRLIWNEDKLNRHIKEGRGQGFGNDYKPWITTQDFPSLGRCSRVAGWKTDRVHEFMSDNETRFFYILEWSEQVIDIREQFPLLDVEKTIKIAEEIGVKHPIDSESNTPYVLTTDFMITITKGGKEQHLARTVKPSTDLEKKRVIEKFEIERRYWQQHNVNWGIVTEKEIPKELAGNIEWIHSAYKLEDTTEVANKELLQIAENMKVKLENSSTPIRRFMDSFDKEMKLEEGTSLYIFKHLIAKKEIFIEMNNKLDLSESFGMIGKVIKKRGVINS